MYDQILNVNNLFFQQFPTTTTTKIQKYALVVMELNELKFVVAFGYRYDETKTDNFLV